MSAIDIFNLIALCSFGVAIFGFGVLVGLFGAECSRADSGSDADEKPKKDNE